MAKRIVITGMGAVSPLGVGVECSWERLLQGKSGVRQIEPFGELPVRIAGTVPDKKDDSEAGLDANQFVEPKEARRMDRFILFALAAASEAIEQAGWSPTEEQKRRTATVIASGIGGLHFVRDTVNTINTSGHRRISPFTVPGFLVNMAAGQVSLKYGFKGPLGAPATACAAGVQAIGDAVRMIQNGEADVAVCGGSEACINEVSIGGFVAAKAMATSFNDRPAEASRPFDTDRDGFVIAEGAGVMVIETLEHALARNATPLAEIVGYGTSADAYHITAAPADGEGAQQCMRAALEQAGIEPGAVNYINAHSTSTPVGDKGELAAIKAVFGSKNVAVSSTKSSTGHLLGAAGGLASIFTAKSLADQVAPFNLNCHKPDEDAEGVDLVLGEPRSMPMEYALCNGFGFGGVNASLLLKVWRG
ncbi:beta-ketoacyl-ACP synthase II [Metapseudomonas boanensis]|uniref:3-oxoacyl-[acyl-carrier-protein] synthase 2 n=1 Tax=Metapseudomonas boanensis TaxID=2822138 RepID=A0ABS5XFW8_9GAMM|nr:beta-ketoacyl-ACP synthase II [Pseudomonas boanensis]MBT8766588.1 beta-ketoacyl-ACP synthase II [Pseudomonas boanensis]